MPPKEDKTKIASDMGRTLLDADTDGDGLEKSEIETWADKNKDGKLSKEEMADLMKLYGMHIGIHQMFVSMENLVEKPWLSCLRGPIVRAINNRGISSLIKIPGTEGRDCTHEEFCNFELGQYGTPGKDGKIFHQFLDDAPSWSAQDEFRDGHTYRGLRGRAWSQVALVGQLE